MGNIIYAAFSYLITNNNNHEQTNEGYKILNDDNPSDIPIKLKIISDDELLDDEFSKSPPSSPPKAMPNPMLNFRRNRRKKVQILQTIEE